MGNKHRKICATSYVIRIKQIKTTLRYYYTSTRMVKIWNNSIKCWQGCKVTGILIQLLMGMQNITATLGDRFLTKLNILLP